MKRPITNRWRLWPLLLGAVLGTHAYGSPAPKAGEPTAFAAGISKHLDFVVPMRAVDRTALADRVRARRLALLQAETPQKAELRSARFTGRDALIAAIMPGGLLYAAYKHQKQRRLEQAIANADTERHELAEDLLVLTGATRNVLVAESAN